jgi:hypothetical protein
MAKGSTWQKKLVTKAKVHAMRAALGNQRTWNEGLRPNSAKPAPMPEPPKPATVSCRDEEITLCAPHKARVVRRMGGKPPRRVWVSSNLLSVYEPHQPYLIKAL